MVTGSSLGHQSWGHGLTCWALSILCCLKGMEFRWEAMMQKEHRVGKNKGVRCRIICGWVGLLRARLLLAPAVLDLGPLHWTWCLGSGPSNRDGRR